MTAAAAKGFLTYLGFAIHLELQRPQIEAARGKDGAHAGILAALQRFKEARAEDRRGIRTHVVTQ